MSASRIVGNKWFILGAVLLAAAAAFMQPATEAVAQSIRKRSVAIRMPLADFDRSVFAKNFEFIQDVGEGSAEAVETEEYFEWAFVPVAEELRGVETIILQTYYYTSEGRTPNIPHTPEVCYRQQGDYVTQISGATLDVAMQDGTSLAIPVTYLKLTQNIEGRSQDACVMYTFCVNGDFLDDRELARIKLAMPWNRAVFFTKIECISSVPKDGDFDKSLAAAKRILCDAIPELLARHLPTQADLTAAAAAPVSAGATAHE